MDKTKLSKIELNWHLEQGVQKAAEPLHGIHDVKTTFSTIHAPD